MNPYPATYWFCGKCEQDYDNEMDAEECCGGSPTWEPDNPDPPTAAELEAMGQQRLI